MYFKVINQSVLKVDKFSFNGCGSNSVVGETSLHGTQNYISKALRATY